MINVSVAVCSTTATRHQIRENAANFDGPAGLVSGVLQGTGGVSANANNYDNRDGQRVGLGTGVFSFGAPRQFEFGLKMTF